MESHTHYRLSLVDLLDPLAEAGGQFGVGGDVVGHGES